MSLSTNIGDFMKSLDKEIEAKIDKRDRLAKSIITNTLSNIIQSSPTDTSYWKANHFISEDSPDFRTVEGDIPSKDNPEAYESQVAKTFGDGVSKVRGIKLKNGKRIIIHNSLKYSQALEDGHSSQNSKMYWKAEQLAKDMIKRGI